jgi:DNA repair exonuclease SbcCD nuclease subunit
MKFLHTADWQIGMKAQSAGKAGPRVREERLAAGRRAVEAGRANQVDFVLVAGDLFENNGIERVLVQKVADIMDEFGAPVFIIPGNHDPLMPGSVWEHPAWKSTRNVRLLLKEEPLEMGEFVLYPCPIREKNSDRNPTAWIPAERGDAIRIGLAHGTVEGIHQDEPDYPVPRDAAQRARLDYLALGHWHSYAPYFQDGHCLMAYSGTHEATKFGERDSGNVLLVEISNPGALPQITPIHTGKLKWIKVEEELRLAGDLARLRKKIESMDDPKNTLIEVEISGLLVAEEGSELDHIEQILASRFISGRLDASRLRPSPEDDDWVHNLPLGIIRETARRLQELIKTGGDSAETAARALMELYAINKEVLQ